MTPDGKSGATSLAFLAEEANPGSAYRKVILAALIAKSQNLSSPIEARLLVARMAEIGPEAAQALIDVNRSAVQSAVESLKEEAAAAHRDTPQEAYQGCKAAHPSLDPYFAEHFCDVRRSASEAKWVANERSGNTVEVSAALAEASGLALPAVVRSNAEPVSLRKCWLANSTWKGNLKTIDFEYAIVHGADFSDAVLDEATTSSLLRNFVDRSMKLGDVLLYGKPSNDNSFLTQACRVSLSDRQLTRDRSKQLRPRSASRRALSVAVQVRCYYSSESLLQGCGATE